MAKLSGPGDAGYVSEEMKLYIAEEVEKVFQAIAEDVADGADELEALAAVIDVLHQKVAEIERERAAAAGGHAEVAP